MTDACLQEHFSQAYGCLRSNGALLCGAVLVLREKLEDRAATAQKKSDKKLARDASARFDFLVPSPALTSGGYRRRTIVVQVQLGGISRMT